MMLLKTMCMGSFNLFEIIKHLYLSTKHLKIGKMKIFPANLTYKKLSQEGHLAQISNIYIWNQHILFY